MVARLKMKKLPMRRLLPLGLVLLILLASARVFGPQGSGTPASGGLLDADPVARAAACRDAGVASLVSRAGDSDWRVRAAAYDGLDRAAPTPGIAGVPGLPGLHGLPMRDTPMADRERWLLAWIGSHRPDLLDELCELHAEPAFLEYGSVLVAECLRCHAGSESRPDLAPERCAGCHGAIHAGWAGSAHAQSLSHLHLPTVDPVTRQAGLHEFGARRGIECAGCHQPAGAASGTCLASFETRSCGSCHAEAQEQWSRWRLGTVPRRASWPPGSLEFGEGDDRDCADCHMPEAAHDWPARRDPAVLRSGAALEIRFDGAGGAEVILTNLTGHDLPTGTRRRLLELWVAVDDAPQRLVAALSPPRPGGAGTDAAARALAPGESRAFALNGTPGRVLARLVYVRNRFAPGSARVEFQSAQRAGPQPAPRPSGRAAREDDRADDDPG